MVGFQVDELLDLIICFFYLIYYNVGLECLCVCLVSVYGVLVDGGVFCFNMVDKGQIDNCVFVCYFVEYRGSCFIFGFGWYYSGEGECQVLCFGIEKIMDGMIQIWEDEYFMVVFGFVELQYLLQMYFEVQVFEYDYEWIMFWVGSFGNVLFVCVKCQFLDILV